eukprot:SAG22_NODE_7093_length_777_cov_1.454277_1_plen_49_part_10
MASTLSSSSSGTSRLDHLELTAAQPRSGDEAWARVVQLGSLSDTVVELT